MSNRTAKVIQKVLWHIRWVLLVGIMFYNIYIFFTSFDLARFLEIHGFTFALYFFLGLWEDYFDCKGSCQTHYDKK
jgi:hypothetical protein